MAKPITTTRVNPYKKGTPKTYKDHGGRVLAYVPKDNPWAKRDPKRT